MRDGCQLPFRLLYDRIAATTHAQFDEAIFAAVAFAVDQFP
jgi:hypothetical protein